MKEKLEDPRFMSLVYQPAWQAHRMGKLSALREILSDFGIVRISQLPEEQFEEFSYRVQALLS